MKPINYVIRDTSFPDQLYSPFGIILVGKVMVDDEVAKFAP